MCMVSLCWLHGSSVQKIGSDMALFSIDRLLTHFIIQFTKKQSLDNVSYTNQNIVSYPEHDLLSHLISGKGLEHLQSQWTLRGRCRAEERAFASEAYRAQLATARSGRSVRRHRRHDPALGTRLPAPQRLLPRQALYALWSQLPGVRIGGRVPTTTREHHSRCSAGSEGALRAVFFLRALSVSRRLRSSKAGKIGRGLNVFAVVRASYTSPLSQVSGNPIRREKLRLWRLHNKA